MTEVIAWVTFAGAWLLVAGPPYQGSVELDELDVDREGIEGIKASAVRTAQGRSASWWWWWLLPPVMYVLHRRWTRAFRQATFAQLTQTLGHRSSRPTRSSLGCPSNPTGPPFPAPAHPADLRRHHRDPEGDHRP